MCRGAKAELVHHAWEVLWENERRNPRNGVLHRVRGGVYSGTSRVRMLERILEVEEDAGLSGGYFRLCGDNGNEELPRSGEEGVGEKKQAKSTQEAAAEEERLRGALGFVGWYFGPCWCFLAVRNPFTLFSEIKRK